MNTPHQNEEFLRSVYKAYQQKDVRAVESLIENLPEISEELITSITPQAWERIALSERPPEPVIFPDDREKPRKVSWKVIVPVVLVCLAALVVFGYLALTYLFPPPSPVTNNICLHMSPLTLKPRTLLSNW